MWEAALKILKVSWKPLLVVVVLTGCGMILTRHFRTAFVS